MGYAYACSLTGPIMLPCHPPPPPWRGGGVVYVGVTPLIALWCGGGVGVLYPPPPWCGVVRWWVVGFGLVSFRTSRSPPPWCGWWGCLGFRCIDSWAWHKPKASVATLDTPRSCIASKVTTLFRVFTIWGGDTTGCGGGGVPTRDTRPSIYIYIYIYYMYIYPFPLSLHGF